MATVTITLEVNGGLAQNPGALAKRMWQESSLITPNSQGGMPEQNYHLHVTSIAIDGTEFPPT